MDRDHKANPAANQPSKAELEEDVRIDATPEALAWPLLVGAPRGEGTRSTTIRARGTDT